MKTEREVVAYLLKSCAVRGWLTRKVQWEGRRSAMDWLVLPGEGLVWWVEAKAPREKPTVCQTLEHTRFRDMGQNVIVVDCKNAVDELICSIEQTLDHTRR